VNPQPSMRRAVRQARVGRERVGVGLTQCACE